MPVADGREDLDHGVVVEGVDGDDVVVAGEASGDVVPTAAWRSHSRYQELREKEVHWVKT